MRGKVRTRNAAPLVLAPGAFILLASLDAAQARCSVTHFTFNFGMQSSTTMTADSGQPCIIKLREGTGTIIKSLVTVTPPARGSTAPQNSVNLAYRSKAGFRGEDRFVFNIIGTKNGVRGTATVAVNVSVRANDGAAAITPVAPRSASTRVAQGQPRQRSARQPNAMQLKCLQQAGASPDPVTKRYTFYVTERDAMGRIDILRLCLAGGDRAKARTISVPERWTY